MRPGNPFRGFPIPRKTTNKKGEQVEGKVMKKVLLIALMASVFAFVPVQRSDAQIYVGIPGVAGVGIGYPGGYYYGYPRYYGYYQYSYYGSYPYRTYYYGGPSYYWYNGHRVYYRHHRHHYYRNY